MKHTQEPWLVDESIPTLIAKDVDGTYRYVCEVQPYQFSYSDTPEDENEANARRIVACVNACAGMEDPAAELDRLRALEAEVVRVWTEEDGSVQLHTPIAWFRVLRLIPSLNKDE